MSDLPINLSPDLTRLKNDGYEAEIVAGHLVIRNVPYVKIQKGKSGAARWCRS